ncbi:hypothetical protein [Calycomorphotria hydatis]|uniref:Uncharacterized protein n=1 Tax=Calycomorphotria hydatis TaxID=2528027 RepID=A0A517T5Z5_9PLAN|nr:hypothetical protein [Calycomorphotria hydatis]QDT63790.1 hypothetical protein V22_10150 [Calycomorphotria hydatis]
MGIDEYDQAEFERLRSEFQSALKKRINEARSEGFRTLDDWLSSSEETAISLSIPSPSHFIAARGLPLPSLGEEWTALIVVDFAAEKGAISYSYADGLSPIFSEFQVETAQFQLPPEHLPKTLSLLNLRNPDSFEDFPFSGYDGGPTKMKIGIGENLISVSGNVCASGSSPSLQLARIVWDLVSQSPRGYV